MYDLENFGARNSDDKNNMTCFVIIKKENLFWLKKISIEL
jgi:hypothetical protein